MPITTPVDEFRLLIGDIDADAYLFTDDEAQWFIDQRAGSVGLAAADACDSLAARFASKVTTTLTSGSDTVRREYRDMSNTYAARAKELRARIVSSTGAPWHGGGSSARKDDLAADSDRVQPHFRRGQFDIGGGTA